MIYHLLAIEPPEQAAQVLLALRTRIFRAAGNASALVLPPVIPLFYLPQGLNPNRVREVLAAARPHWRFCEAGIGEQDGIFYLQTHCTAEPAAGCGSLEAKILETQKQRPEPAPVLFPPVNGFFLAVKQPGTELAALRALWDGQASPLVFAAYRVVLLKITVHAAAQVWWQNIEWEIAVEVRGGGRASAP